MPATDDEIMEVADLLKVESIDMDIVTDNEKNVRIAIEESSDATTTLLESSGFHLNKHPYLSLLLDYEFI